LSIVYSHIDYWLNRSGSALRLEKHGVTSSTSHPLETLSTLSSQAHHSICCHVLLLTRCKTLC